MGQKPTKSIVSQGLNKLFDLRQPEVTWAIGSSLVMELLVLLLRLHSNFALYENHICSLIQCVIAGLISFIGIAIAGIAIVIALFTTQEIKLINKLVSEAFDDLLFDFKWFAFFSAIEVAIYLALFFIIGSPYPIAPAPAFYFTSLLLMYGSFYLLFYGYALVGNFIKMAKLKCSLDAVLTQSKSAPVSAIEIALEFLLSKLLDGDMCASREFISELIAVVEKSSICSKGEIVEYLKRKYNSII